MWIQLSTWESIKYLRTDLDREMQTTWRKRGLPQLLLTISLYTVYRLLLILPFFFKSYFDNSKVFDVIPDPFSPAKQYSFHMFLTALTVDLITAVFPSTCRWRQQSKFSLSAVQLMHDSVSSKAGNNGGCFWDCAVLTDVAHLHLFSVW